MFRSTFLYFMVVVFLFGTLQSQSINNVKLLFHEKNTAIYECAASPVGNLVSFRTSAGDVDKHYIYDFVSGSLSPVFTQEESFLGDVVQKNTQNLIWSAVDAQSCLLKVVEDGKTSFAEVIMRKNGQVDFRPLLIKKEELQLTTATFLSWNTKGKALLSLCEGDIPPGTDIPASSYDLYTLRTKTSGITRLGSHTATREFHASPLNNGEFILSGVGDTGMNELHQTDGKNAYIRLTDTPRLSESWPAVSPKDDFVVFSHPHGKTENTADLYIMPTSGGTPELLATDIYIPVTSYSSSGIYQWAKDGKGVVFISYNPDRKNPLARVDIESKEISFFDIDVVFPSSFAISGDEKHILIVAAGTSESNEQTSYKAFVGEYNH